MTDAEKDFSIICLQMCEVSYLPLVQIPKYIAEVNPFKPHEPWECTWAWQNEDNSNLAFVALHHPVGKTAKREPPDQAILAIRGTDIDVSDIWGVLWQAWQDLDFLIQVHAPGGPKGAKIAQGTKKGAEQILGLMSPGQSLQDYLNILFTEHPGLKLTVTGHSLGGCLATVVASELRTKHEALQVVTFAAPTAGNQPFADHFETQFKDARCYASKFDIAPWSWGELTHLDTIYDQEFLLPDTVVAGILGLEIAMPLFTTGYAQPKRTELCNAKLSGAPDWYAEAFYQHHPTTYMKWLGGEKNVGITPPAVVSSGKPTKSTLGGELARLIAEILGNLPKPAT